MYTRTESVEITTIVASTTLAQAGSVVFFLGMIPGSTLLVQLFDRYRIVAADVMFRPYLNQLSVGTTPPTLSRLHTVVDFDDDTSPASVNEMEKYGTYASVVVNRPLRRHLVPRAAATVYYSVTPGYAELNPQSWIDCANASVPHYGVKYYLPVTTAANTYGYVVSVTLTVQLAGAR